MIFMTTTSHYSRTFHFSQLVFFATPMEGEVPLPVMPDSIRHPGSTETHWIPAYAGMTTSLNAADDWIPASPE
jgi:hypothetical protein